MVRLSWGPLNLDFLTPQIEEAFKAPQVGISATIGHTQLVWRKWHRLFEIDLVDVQFQKDQNPQWISIEHIGVSFRFYRFLLGEVSLEKLRFYHPHVLFEKDEKGEYALGLGQSALSQDFALENLLPFFALSGPSTVLGKLNEVTKISIIEAHTFLRDQEANQEWELPKTTCVLRRKLDGFRIELILQPQQGAGALKAEFAHQIGSARFDVNLDLDHISFESLLKKKGPIFCPLNPEILDFDDALNFLQCWDVPLNGKVHLAAVPATLQVIEGTCDVDLGKGTLTSTMPTLLPFVITSGNVSLVLSPHEIDLKKVGLLSEEALFQFSGKLVSPNSPLSLLEPMQMGHFMEIEGKMEDFPIDYLEVLWPKDLAVPAREWLTQNLRMGVITEATFLFKGHEGESGFKVDGLDGTLAGKGVEITYLKGLPAAKNVAAQAIFDKTGFNIQVLAGEIDQIKVQEGHVLISALDTDDEQLSLNLKVKGPLPDFLDVIDHKPLEYASYGKIDPKNTKGEGTLSLNLDFPLKATLKFKDVKMAATGTFQNVALDRKISEELTSQLTDGSLSLNLTHNQMEIKGEGLLNQLPATLTYRHFFEDTAAHEVWLKVETTASFADFKRLGFDWAEYAQGLTQALFIYTLDRNKKSNFFVNLDITQATLSFFPLEWEKMPGEKGRLSFNLLFNDGQLAKMSDLRMLSPTCVFKGEILFGAEKDWKTIHLSSFRGPHTQTQVTLHTPRKDAYEVSFKGQSVDLEKFLDYVNKKEDQDHPPTDIKLFADVDQLRLGEGKIFQSVKAEADLFLQGKMTTWKTVHLRAKAGKGTANRGDMAKVSGGVLFDITPGPNNTQTLEVRANDAGAFLKNLSIYEDIGGGYITIKGKRQGQGPYKGTFKLKDFEAYEVHLLGRFAALLSPIGIVNLFSEKKVLSMEKFEADFDYSEDLVVVRKGIGKSLSLGFTVEGKIDQKNRIYALNGNITPARFLNSILNNIPLVGDLLNGGEGEGIFAIAYSVKGSFDAPNIHLNPLSILAPGFIRNIFQSIDGD